MTPAVLSFRFRLPGCRFLSALLISATVAIALPGLAAPSAASEFTFRNDVMAVLSKAGCNAGACHGNANGKAGFKLSLRGEDPDTDYDVLTRDQFGRRINPIAPESSLILLKATAQISHEGGKRFAQDSTEYKILHQWLERGGPRDAETTPRLVEIDVTPRERILVEPERSVSLKVTAKFSDGEQRDITKMAVYEPASSVATVSAGGYVEGQMPGETTVLVRYLHAQVPVRLAFVPARPDFHWKHVPAHNYIDEYVFAKLRTLRMNPSELCDDTVFLRRAYLDLLGILPTAAEARAFINNSRPDKRALLIDTLLQRPEFADTWALKWSDLLRNEERALDQKGVQNFHHWIRRSIETGKPLDQFARELIAARGSTYLEPAANFYRANRTPVIRAEAAAQVFLGTRLQCAQCHNHPFDRWTQDDYYNWAAVFARVDYKILENRRQDNNDKHEFKGEQIVFVSRKGDVQNPRTKRPAEPRLLGADAPLNSADTDPLQQLAEWVSSPDNPFFARSQVNRIWYHLMGRGIVDPIDDFRATNPASHPELLEALARDLVEHQFDLRHMIRTIMNSRSYQLSSEPNDTNAEDELNYSHALVRRLTAEQLLDCQSQVAGVDLTFQGYPEGLRAGEIPGARPERVRGARSGPNDNDRFLEVFGKPPRLLTCECERSTETTMSQAFQMISGPTINKMLAAPNNRLGQLVASTKPDHDHELVNELFWSALSRAPTESELHAAVHHLRSGSDRRAALEDVAWSVMNAKEFILRR